MLVYSFQNTNRLKYVLDFLLKQQLGIDYTFELNLNTFKNTQLPKLNYSKEIINGAINISPNNLLFENCIFDYKPDVEINIYGVKLFINESPDFGFDILSAIFWMISRYEEYQPFEKDMFGRFSSAQSLGGKYDFLQLPVVDLWVNTFSKVLLNKYPNIIIKKKCFKVIATFDIDSPWSYKNKGFLRNMAGLCRDFMYCRFSLVKERLSVLFNLVDDPFYQFNQINKICNNFNIKPLLFFLLGSYAKYDKTIAYKNKEFKKLIVQTKEYADIGIHPSFKAANSETLKNIEKKRLENITGEQVCKSRQHFLKIDFPDYYRQLINVGITSDYSLGYANQIGFRAGTSNEFYFFDLLEDKQTNLKIIPFSIMDVTLKNYMGLQPHQAIKKGKEFINVLKNINGTFVCLWHNESFSENKEWKGWKTVYEQLLTYAQE